MCPRKDLILQEISSSPHANGSCAYISAGFLMRSWICCKFWSRHRAASLKCVSSTMRCPAASEGPVRMPLPPASEIKEATDVYRDATSASAGPVGISLIPDTSLVTGDNLLPGLHLALWLMLPEIHELLLSGKYSSLPREQWYFLGSWAGTCQERLRSRETWPPRGWHGFRSQSDPPEADSQ